MNEGLPMAFPLKKDADNDNLPGNDFPGTTSVSPDITEREIRQTIDQIRRQQENLKKRSAELDTAIQKVRATRRRLDYINRQLQLAARSGIISQSVH
jgi:hypothetical protein